MKNLVLALVLLFPIVSAPAQTILDIKKSCAYYDDEAQPETVYVFEPSQEAERIVAEIVDAISLPKNFTTKSSDIKNAMATMEGGRRYILYSTEFLEEFKADARTRWAAYSVLAHEIGHHLSGHNFAETNPQARKKMELEADIFSGGVLRLLGAGLAEAQAGIRTVALAKETATHPPAPARREAVANGWKKQDERLREMGQSGTPPPNPRPALPSTSDVNPGKDCALCPEMVLVPGGTYTMGCTPEQGSYCQENEKPAHPVQVPDFYIGKYEVTNAEWQAVTGEIRPGDCPKCPVVRIYFNDALEFIELLNEKTGQNFRLPTEAEWEYAARGGAKSKNFKYAGSNNPGLVAWWSGNSGDKPHPVGERKANELGIYDMSGNVLEWCADLFHENYEGAPMNGSAWDKGKHWGAVCRGGSWAQDQLNVRVSARNTLKQNSSFARPVSGFRLALDK